MLDAYSLPQSRSPAPGSDLFAQPVLQLFILCDRDRSALSRRDRRALCAERTMVTGIRVKFDEHPWSYFLHFTCGTGDCHLAHVHPESCLRKCLPVCVTRDPGLTHDIAAKPEDVIDDGAVDVTAINMQFIDRQPLALNIGRELLSRFFFGSVRRRDRARQDQVGIKVRRDMALIPVKALALALATMRVRLSYPMSPLKTSDGIDFA